MRIRLFEEYSEVLYSPMLMSDWLTKIYDPMKGMMGSLYEIEKFTDSEKDLMKKTLEDIAKDTIKYRVSFGANNSKYCTAFNLSSLGTDSESYFYFGDITVYKRTDEWFYVKMNLPYKYMVEIYIDSAVVYQYKCDTIDGVLSLFNDLLKPLNNTEQINIY